MIGCRLPRYLVMAPFDFILRIVSPLAQGLPAHLRLRHFLHVYTGLFVAALACARLGVHGAHRVAWGFDFRLVCPGFARNKARHIDAAHILKIFVEVVVSASPHLALTLIDNLWRPRILRRCCIAVCYLVVILENSNLLGLCLQLELHVCLLRRKIAPLKHFKLISN